MKTMENMEGETRAQINVRQKTEQENKGQMKEMQNMDREIKAHEDRLVQ